ncbi:MULTISPECIES: hypothetical protein [Sphingomonas]|uniref:hypothetical protein n=1 Tax=Sphingomonas TaxID=13687 RepID=UPI000F7F5332|nr:hypothetical protein [Sphingomonas sp. ABOLF]GLK19300.1 hypothetical protein GCM10017606_01260 [Microbacterium terregens]
MAIVLMGTGGSSGRTLAAVEAALQRRRPAQSVRFIDTQPFNLRTGGRTSYPGNGEVRVADPDACGMRRATGSWSMNMLLNGGPLMYRRMQRYGARLIGSDADVLVMCHDRIYIETAMIRAARQSGAATVLIQEGPFCSIAHGGARAPVLRLKGALAPLATTSGLLPKIPGYGCAGHDLILAASPEYRARWIDAGVQQERVRVGGVPRYDPLALLPPTNALSSDGVLRVLYLTQPFAAHGKVDAQVAAELETMVAEGLRMVAGRMPVELTIRVHPRAEAEHVFALQQSVSGLVRIDKGERPLETTLGEYDVVLGHYSSGLLESLVAGKRILCVPVPETAFAETAEGDKQAWLTAIGAPVARSASEIADCLSAIRRGEPTRVQWDKVGAEVGVIDGQSSDRCADAILELIDRRANRNQAA